MTDERPPASPAAVRGALEEALRTGRVATPAGVYVLRCGVWLGPGMRCMRPRGHEPERSPTWSTT